MDKAKIEGYLHGIEVLTDQVRQELNTPDVAPTVRDANELAERLHTKGEVVVERGQILAGSGFEVEDNTNLNGQMSTLLGINAPAIVVRPGMTDSVLRNLVLESSGISSVLQLGSNDIESQNTVDKVPTDFLLDNVNIFLFRGKRGIEVNSASTVLKNCNVRDVYDGTDQNRDSQAVWLGNTPGYLTIEGGVFEAASECFLSGGDDIKIGVPRRMLRITGALFTKNMAWKGVVRVKNVLEYKDMTDAIVTSCVFENCWKDLQAGEALMLTPTRGGQVRDVSFIGCEARNVSSFANITGVDSHGINKTRTTASFVDCKVRTNSKLLGGRGNFALIDRGPESVTIQGCDIEIDGSSFLELVGTLPMDLLRITNNRFNCGNYGIRIAGLNHGDNSKGLIKNLQIEGNTIYGASSLFKGRFPNNTYA